jgi:hypothetical protein
MKKKLFILFFASFCSCLQLFSMDKKTIIIKNDTEYQCKYVILKEKSQEQIESGIVKANNQVELTEPKNKKVLIKVHIYNEIIIYAFYDITIKTVMDAGSEGIHVTGCTSKNTSYGVVIYPDDNDQCIIF